MSDNADNEFSGSFFTGNIKSLCYLMKTNIQTNVWGLLFCIYLIKHTVKIMKYY